MRHAALLICASIAVGLPQAASAADFGGPVEYPGGAPRYPAPYGDLSADPRGERGRPARRVTRSSDYAGSEWGLSKPSYYGLAPRPDWGRSSLD